MKKAKTALFAIYALVVPQMAGAAADTWFAIAVNENRIATGWVQLKSYESLNEDSFRLNAKFTNNRGAQIAGRIDINCKNKDFYFRPNGLFAQRGPWAAIPEGSGIQSIGRYFCRRTNSKTLWGYGDETKHLWDQPAPTREAGDAEGDWVLATETDEAEVYYNDKVLKRGDYLQVATWSRSKKGERSAAQPGDTQGYWWINVDCKSNRYTTFMKPDSAVEGVWLNPTPGRPGGAAMAARKRFCTN